METRLELPQQKAAHEPHVNPGEEMQRIPRVASIHLRPPREGARGYGGRRVLVESGAELAQRGWYDDLPVPPPDVVFLVFFWGCGDAVGRGVREREGMNAGLVGGE